MQQLQNKSKTYEVYLKQINQKDLTEDGREELLSNTTSGFSRSWGETSETLGKSNKEILDLQKAKINDQDVALLQISKSVDRQKQIATAIGDELEVHIDLLNDMDPRIDRVTSKVIQGMSKTFFIQVDYLIITLYI